jgi:hypothetical protein
MTETHTPQDLFQGHCRRLRCKEMFIETAAEFKITETGSGIYWCSHTQNCLGPDGQVAEPADCKTGRSCYEGL